jgi:hypothetical protein
MAISDAELAKIKKMCGVPDQISNVKIYRTFNPMKAYRHRDYFTVNAWTSQSSDGYQVVCEVGPYIEEVFTDTDNVYTEYTGVEE